MARRSREAIQKRLRERKRSEKAELKRQKRLERKKGLEPGEGELEAAGGIVLATQAATGSSDGEAEDATAEPTTIHEPEPTADTADNEPERRAPLRPVHTTTD